MNNNCEEKVTDQTPKWLTTILPLISAVLGGGALWYTWFIYNDMGNRSGIYAYWYEWIRPGLIGLVGILCLLATLLFILGKSSGRSVFMGGLSIIPAILVLNLVILVARVIQNIIQGKAQPFFEHLFTQPKSLLIPIVVIALVLLGALGKKDKNKSSD